MKVLFLDFDGVLNSSVFFAIDKGFGGLSPDLVRNLNTIVTNTNCVVVVSSDWRRGRSVEDLQHILGEAGFKGNVCDTTPIFNFTHNLEDDRVGEIHNWLTQGNPFIESWVAIDDMDLSSLGENHFVRTTFTLGLTEDLAAKAIRLLNA